MSNEHVESLCEFYDLDAPLGLWLALGARGRKGNDGDGYTVDWGNHRGEQRAAYAMELIERARDELEAAKAYNAKDEKIIMRRVMTLYGKDRMARTLSALSSSINEISVTVDGVDRLATALQDFAATFAARG